VSHPLPLTLNKAKELRVQPLVTVVTPCFNSAQFIEATILSVLNQIYTPIEYIIMDGGSTDETANIVRKYASRLTFVSEPDRGQSDAINKGWQMAKGDIVAWMNADDRYSPDTVATAVQFLQAHPDTKWVYGDAQYVDPEGVPYLFRTPVYRWSYRKLLTDSNYILQPTVFLRREVLDQFGLLHEDLHYVMDYEYWLRIGQTFPGHYVPALRVEITYYPETKTASGGVRRILELESVVHRYGASAIPRRHQVEWTTAYLEETVARLKNREWLSALEALSRSAKYRFGLAAWLYKASRNLLPARLKQAIRRRYTGR
jgi:glycosyltransferase involved in cell wall biosynthesis